MLSFLGFGTSKKIYRNNNPVLDGSDNNSVLNQDVNNSFDSCDHGSGLKHDHDGIAFMGGGARGIAHLGAIVALQELGILKGINKFSGASVGSIAALLCAMKLESYSDLKDDFDMSQILKGDSIGRLGMFSGSVLKEKIRQLIIKGCGNKSITFSQLREQKGTTLIVSATLVYTDKFEAVYFSPDTTPDMKVAHAIYHSCCYPLVFDSYGYMDGGLTDNFPIDKLECKNPIGFAFQTSSETKGIKPNGIIDITLSLVTGMLNQQVHYEKAIYLPTMDVGTLDFFDSKGKLDDLYTSAYQVTTSRFC